MNPPSAPTWVARVGAIFRGVDWFVPPYFQGGALRELADIIESAPESKKHEVVEVALERMYGPDYVAAMLFERYVKVPPVDEFSTNIREALEASALGLPHAAIATLLPVIEGVLRKVAEADARDLGSGTRRLAAEIRRMADDERRAWAAEPEAETLREQLDMLEQLATFMTDRLLVQTAAYAGIGNLNRHGILHGVFSEYGTEYNFHKLVSFLDALVFTLSSKVAVSCFAPSGTPDSRKFATYLRGLRLARRIRPSDVP